MESSFGRIATTLGPCTLLAALLSGCAAMQPHLNEPAPSVESGWSEPFRTTKPSDKAFGISSKAREIERNLGFE